MRQAGSSGRCRPSDACLPLLSLTRCEMQSTGGKSSRGRRAKSPKTRPSPTYKLLRSRAKACLRPALAAEPWQGSAHVSVSLVNKFTATFPLPLPFLPLLRNIKHLNLDSLTHTRLSDRHPGTKYVADSAAVREASKWRRGEEGETWLLGIGISICISKRLERTDSSSFAFLVCCPQAWLTSISVHVLPTTDSTCTQADLAPLAKNVE